MTSMRNSLNAELMLNAMLLFLQTNPYYVKPRLADHQFGIKHYAGEVSFIQNGPAARHHCVVKSV